MPKIFLSYRRDDSAYVTESIYSALKAYFTPEDIFFDIDSGGLGLDFRKDITDAVAQCDVLLAVIGNAWLHAVDGNGKRRLDNPADYVRLEIEAALSRDIPVVPVLVDEESIPLADALPDTLKALAFRRATPVRAGKDFEQDLQRLMKGIEKVVNAPVAARPVTSQITPPAAMPQTPEALLSGTGIMQVSSLPTNADVSLDGIKIGVTPFNSDTVLPGSYTLEVYHPDYLALQQPLVVVANGVIKLNLSLKQAYGGLVIITDPVDAKVTLDGEPQTELTPLQFDKLTAGEHLVSVSKAGFTTEESRPEVKADSILRHPITLQQVPHGTLNFSVIPADAPVEVDGMPAFQSGMSLAYGKYQINIPKGNYAGRFHLACQREVEISAATTEIEISLTAIGPVMVSIPAGSFQMGSNDGRDSEKPVHTVNINQAFELSQYAITFEEYDQFANATKRALPDDEGWGRDRRPVINVSWRDAQAYVAWLSTETGERYRLPSEAEWEYAARAGTTTAYCWADDISLDNANYGNIIGKTTPVGQYAANPFGLYDMHGNVWEWTADRWHDSYQGAPVDGSVWSEGGDGTRQVLRGGGWVDSPANLRSANRYWINSDGTDDYVGFRVARAR
ncbi:MAG: SUMF1/EgtB/PvdO family nonheme iron enzyme [Pseudomonadales bacterium]|nr:SUMF1/EgtB/PvdO family nonheme iron enzyme [Pseudomonadales bacterium]